ncbi:methylated-DNA--protein-cysteine methyltransferase [Skermanella stibiiresistens SB22]|uniref:Methylated-DNA--protein-cysteine methyltransferase n=1 Tax=Skermanella stibiiresistens SB22 TaxID=1385369 RepID=W9H9T6_9PROT|nr:methylated-DNA--[protein]-cysteine S-methyltransferase [Skermanella stibiiresistens]EWY40598.1 methylated-DNA--protein-cysteine methyltransferase [Skermanella stibiiresistens SB22]
MARLTVESPLGPLTLTSTAGVLTALDWRTAGAASDNDAVLDEAARQLRQYFDGQRATFDLPMSPAGTPFQKRVWAAMLEIPCGRTATYGDLARQVDSAPRAVGGACGRNPLPIVIPCHRVVAGTGKGGYSGFGGLTTKDWLLDLERRLVLVPTP